MLNQVPALQCICMRYLQISSAASILTRTHGDLPCFMAVVAMCYKSYPQSDVGCEQQASMPLCEADMGHFRS